MLKRLIKKMGPLPEAVLRIMLIIASMLPSHTVRKLALRLLGVKIGRGVMIFPGFEIRCPWRLTILRGAIIGHNCILDARAGLTIGEDVNLSSEVAIWTAQHDPHSPSFDAVYGAVTLERRVWLSFRTTVLPGVTIHEGAVLAAHAVASKDIEPFTIAGGIPARKIGERNRELTYRFGVG
jgi:acetyltransferase-like isoleucine patch superfamily enzyme